MSSISGLGSGSGWSQMQMTMRPPHVDKKQMAADAFAKIDTANQGYFDEKGFEAAINQALSSSQSTKSYSSEQMQTAFNKLDADGNGQVTQQEFTSSLSQLMGRHHHSEARNASDGDGDDNGTPGMMAMQGMGGMQGMGNMPPLPPSDGTQNGNGSDQGFTADELKAQLSDTSASDAKRTSLIQDVLNNFSKADADGNGKVNFAEALQLEKSLSSATASSNTQPTSVDSTSTTDPLQQRLMQQLMQMIAAYGQNMGSSSTHASQLSLTA